MRLLKLIAIGALIAGFSMTSAMAANGEFAVKGKKYYQKKISKKYKVTGIQLLKILGVNSTNKIQVKKQLDKLFANNAEKLIAKLKEAKQDKLAKAFSKLKGKKLEVIHDFLFILKTDPNTLGGGC